MIHLLPSFLPSVMVKLSQLGSAVSIRPRLSPGRFCSNAKIYCVSTQLTNFVRFNPEHNVGTTCQNYSAPRELLLVRVLHVLLLFLLLLLLLLQFLHRHCTTLLLLLLLLLQFLHPHWHTFRMR